MSSPVEFLHREMASTWQWRIDTDPELAASLGLLGQRRSTHAIDPRSPESFTQRLEWIERALERITSGLSPEQIANLTNADKLSHELYVTQLSDYCHYTRQYKAYVCCINRLEGPQTDLALYARYLPLVTKESREFYRDFLAAIPIQLAQVIQLLQLGLEEDRTPPKVSLEGVVKQIRGMVNDNMSAFRKPIDGCFVLPDEETLKMECQELISGVVNNAFSNLADFLETKYIPNLRDEISATKGYPNGKEYYNDCLKFHTTTNMTPLEIHQMGLDEVQRMRNEMNEIAASAGYADRLEEYMEHLRTSPEYESKSGEELCAHYRDITGRIAPAMLNLFHLKTLPRSPFQIVETPAAHASMAPAAYYLAGSADAKAPRPGTFYVNTSELPTRRTYECEALALHEAIPGHHTQGAVQGESDTLPAFRRYAEDRRYFEAPCRFPFYTGYIEGWGLHCETLGKELGLYKRPEDRMGQLSMEALRACRLVVDTGMHAFGWSLEKAFEYMVQNTAMGEHDARTEVVRYVTWPGQATAYKVGERFIRKLRTTAETKLGSKFDPRDFYHVVLNCGPVPLDVLEKLVDEYIESASFDGGGATLDEEDVRVVTDTTSAFVEGMTFANWCKCCIVPGTCKAIVAR
jgi:uncharacterized protein (DUF885 family)